MLAQATHQKLKNAESSILFMREQHAKTLEGLHEEIHKLQKKNARLTFELTMKGCTSAPAEVTECSECQHLEESLTNSKTEILKLRSALAKSEDKLTLLDHQLEEVHTKFGEEVQLRDDNLSKQSGELETKANTIAMLTQQLYNTKIRLRNEIQANNTTTSSHATSSAVCVCPHCHVHRKQAIVTGDRHYVIHEGGGMLEQVPSSANTTSPAATRSRISRIQRRHFRNSSSPAAHEVSSLYDASEDNYTPNITGTQKLPTPPLTPRPPPTSSPAPSTVIRRASKTVRKQSPSPRSNRGQTSVGDAGLSSHVSNLKREEDARSSSAVRTFSATSISNEKKVLDPIQVHRQGVMPEELRELLQSRGSEGGMQLISSKPAPLPPIANPGEETTPIQSELFHYNPATTTIDSNELSSSSTRLKGHPHHAPRQHRHFILAKAQGLSSAPSTVRVLRYPPKQQGDFGKEGVAGGLLEPGEIKDNNRVAIQGTLLVKETIDRNDSTLQELHQR